MPGTAIDRVRAAIALGIAVTNDELALLQRAHCDGPVVALVVDDPLVAAAHDDLAPEIRSHLAASPDQRLAAAAGLHHSAPASLISATLRNQAVQVLITSAPARLADHSRAVLIEHGGARERRAVARSTSVARQLERLATDADESVRIAVAWNVAATANAHRLLAADAVAGVRAAVARRSGLSPALLTELAGDPHDTVRTSVASNRATPPEALMTLSTDPVDRVRQAVASNRHVAGAHLSALAADPDTATRARVAANRQTDPIVLAAFRHDPEPDVRRHLAANPSLTDPAVFRDLVGRVPNIAIAANPSAPADVLDGLLRSNDLIAGRPIAPADAQRSEALALARNPSCSPQAIEALLDWALSDDGPHPADRLSVARRLALNPAATATAIRRLGNHRDAQVQKRLADR